MLLAAPTGKAAARMTEALSTTTHHAAVTLHRLLGIRPQSATPWHHAGNPLVADVVIVDEASMIDLALMAKLFAATPPGARLILLGDRDQLASVEAGHVLGDICEAAAAGGGGGFHALQRNFRFSSESGIQKLSAAVNRGETEAALALLAKPTEHLAGRALPAPGALAGQLREMILQAHRRTMQAASPGEALLVQSAFRILCAIRGGPYGVEHLNRLAESILAGFIQPAGRHYPGRPIMILQNDYNLGLFNGEIGVILPNPADTGRAARVFSRRERRGPQHPRRAPARARDRVGDDRPQEPGLRMRPRPAHSAGPRQPRPHARARLHRADPRADGGGGLVQRAGVEDGDRAADRAVQRAARTAAGRAKLQTPEIK